MAETGASLQIQEQIAALSRVTHHHDQTLQEIQKQLQSINAFMQKTVEAEDKRNSSSGLRGHAASTELTLVNPSKPLKLEFSKFQGEDPSCWIYRANEFFLSTLHQSIRRYLWYLITWTGRH